MKRFVCLLIFISLACCEKASVKPGHAMLSGHEREQRYSAEWTKFHEELVKLYAQSKASPEAMLIRIDSFLIDNKNEKDEYKSQIKSSIENELNYFKAELYYKLKKHDKSLKILLDKNRHPHGGIITGYDALAIAANYTRLKQHEYARSFIDSMKKSFYIHDFAWGNYYETVGDKENAIKVYREIEGHREWRHYAYHPLAMQRLKELQKPNPKLLNELYYPTGNPSFDIAPTNDNHIRTRIFDFFDKLPECKGLERHIFRSPQTNDEDYYWIKVGNGIEVGHDYEPYYEAQYDFFVYPEDFRVMNYNPKTKTLLTLEE